MSRARELAATARRLRTGARMNEGEAERYAHRAPEDAAALRKGASVARRRAAELEREAFEDAAFWAMRRAT